MNIFKEISNQRSAIMGIGIISILLYHARHFFDHTSLIMTFFFNLGYGGVDIFLFVSGFGLYYSSLKKPSLGKFYASRFIRVVPAYLIVMAVLFAIDGTFMQFLKHTLCTYFWFQGKAIFWYVPTILTFYLFFPLYLKFFEKSKYITTIVTIVLSVVCFFLFFGDYGDLRSALITRVPIFVLGVLAGFLSLKEKLNTKYWRGIIYFLGTVSLIVLYVSLNYYSDYLWKGLYWYPFIFITIASVFLFCELLKFVKKTNLLYRILVFLGGISLEIYLVHEYIFGLEICIDVLTSVGTVCLSLLISLVFAYLLSRLSNWIKEKSIPYINKL